MTTQQKPRASDRPEAHLDIDSGTLTVHHLEMRDPAVVQEARRWASGSRRASADTSDLQDADLSPFVEQAIAVGARALAGAAGHLETANVGALIADLSNHASSAVAGVTTATERAVEQAASAIKQTSTDVRTSFEDIAATTRRSLQGNVNEAKMSFIDEMRRLVGGDNPELLVALAPTLEKFGRDLEEHALKRTTEMTEKVARQFDPDDPSSPMSKHTRELGRRQQELADTLGQGQKTVETKVEELSKAFALVHATRTGSAASMTTLKGTTFETSVHLLLDQIAAGLGDDYAETGARSGNGSTSKKGDGVLTVEGGDVRIVLEMTDSPRKDWNAYLAQAERNRDAVASIGLTRTAEQLGGHTIRSFGPRRIVLAFDPENDDHELLRTIVQVVRVAAIAASRRQDDTEIATAQESIDEAVTLLDKFDNIKRTASLIVNSAKKIESDTGSVTADLVSALERAQRALAHGAGAHGHEAA
jgi:hypothetical protein